MKNYGFIEPIIVPEDYFLGSGKLGSQIINPSGNWLKYLPKMEKQRITFETNACVSFTTTSALEMIHKLLYKVEPNYSDRFLAKASDTKPNAGNTPKKVSEAVRKYGTVPENIYPMTTTLKEYYQDIPTNLKSIGGFWLKDYKFGYEYVDKSQLKEALKRSPVGVAVYAWATNDKGEYVKLGPWGHYVVLVAYDEKDRPIIFDSYDKELKTLIKDYDFGFPQIYTLKKRQVKGKISLWQKIINWVKLLWETA